MRTVRLFGLDFATDTTVDGVASQIERDGLLNTPKWRVVVTPNVDHLVHYKRSASLRVVAQTAHIVLPDGAPIVWTSRLLRAPIDRRIAGSDLFVAWWRRVVKSERPILVVAGNKDLAQHLSNENPRCRCIVPPIFDIDDTIAIENLRDEILTELNWVPVDAVVIGLSMEKNHRIAIELSNAPPPASGAPLLLLLGAAAEFHAGQQTRAPRWMQRFGIEWLHRLFSDPRRMAKRYLIDGLTFVPMLWKEWRSRRSATSADT